MMKMERDNNDDSDNFRAARGTEVSNSRAGTAEVGLAVSIPTATGVRLLRVMRQQMGISLKDHIVLDKHWRGLVNYYLMRYVHK